MHTTIRACFPALTLARNHQVITFIYLLLRASGFLKQATSHQALNIDYNLKSTMKTILLGFSFGTSISIVSWMIGILFNGIFSKREFYKKLGNLNFIESAALNKKIGMEYFKWMVKHTFFKFFNQKIKIDNKNNDFRNIRNEMTLAEISHLVGFVFVTLFAIYYIFRINILYGLAIMIPNIFLNLYPSLLQQANKRRIDKLINKQTVSQQQST